MIKNELIRAKHLQEQLLKDNFRWPKKSDYIHKISEELEEISLASSTDRIREEIGDLFLACTALAAIHGVDPSLALSDSINMFKHRYKEWKTLSEKEKVHICSKKGKSRWKDCKKITDSVRKTSSIQIPTMRTLAILGSWDERDKNILDTGLNVGRIIADAGATLVSGGGPGVMAEATRGAHQNGGLTVGILGTRDPKSEGTFPETEIIIPTGLGWDMRSALMIRMVDAVIVVGGAVGTLQEITMAYINKVPIIIIECQSDLEKRLRNFCIDEVWIDQRKLVPIIFCQDMSILNTIIRHGL